MSGLQAGISAAVGVHSLAPSVSAFGTPGAALHWQSATALAHASGFTHPGTTVLGLVAAGVLWTAVEYSAASGRVPSRRRLTALGWGLLLAIPPLVSLGLAFTLCAAGPTSARWLLVVALVAFSGISVITSALGWDLLASTCLRRKSVLVVGQSSDWLEIGARQAPGYDPAFLVAGALSAAERRTLASGGRKGRKIWGVVASDDATLGNSELRKCCHRARVRLLGANEFRELWSRRIDVDRAGPGAVAAARSLQDSLACRITRRIGDIALSLMLLVVTLPVAVAAAVLIKLDSRGPIFYWQERVGLHGRSFWLVKFRSMYVDAEANSGPQWAGLADPRVTRVGALLRRARVDELPQLWNVLRGEMSMIGPRPERPFFVAQLTAQLPCYDDRSLVKPGITGWAQVNYRYGASVEDARVKLAYDLYYVKYRSALFDLRILAATVRVVLFGEGAR